MPIPHGTNEKQIDRKADKVLKEFYYQINHKSGIQEPMIAKSLTQYSVP